MKRKSILAGAAALVLAASALAADYFYIPGGCRPSFNGEETIRVCLNKDGSMELNWPEARPLGAAGQGPGENSSGISEEVPANAPEEDAAGVSKEVPANAPEEDAAGVSKEVPANAPAGGPANVTAAGRPEEAVFYEVDVKSGGLHFQKFQSYPGVLLDEFTLPITVRVRAVTDGKNLLGLSRPAASPWLEAKVEPVELNAPEAVAAPGPGVLSLKWTLAGPDPGYYEIFTLDEGGAYRRAATAAGKAVELRVGREGDVSMPGYSQPLRVAVRAGVQGEGYVLCGPASNVISVARQDLLGDELNLICQESEPRVFTLEWDEVRGERYELQEWDGEKWALLDALDPAERFTYELGRLRSGSRHRFQVVVTDANGTVRSSEEVEFSASVDPLYATVWPIIDQEYHESADASSPALGKIPGGTALCVLEERGDWFQVRYKEKYGYVDSRFCMINLPEYAGDHCEYDITNSYQSIFKVHENPIALITDQVIAGFEYVQEADGEFLVPYLYPCAKKLLTAAQQAEEDGYRLKIYEAFRPNEATRYLYDTTAAQLDWAALVYEEGEDADDRNAIDPVTGWVVDLADGLLTDPETDEKLSREDLALRQEQEAAGAGGEAGLTAEGETVPTGGEGQVSQTDGTASTAPETPAVPADQPDSSQPFIFLPEEGTKDESGLMPADPAPQDQEDQHTQGDAQSQDGEEEGEEPEEEYDTYFKIMTNNGRFHLGSFLARVTSAHNRGIALDLTLEKIDSGEELEMQSAIHDLSWYSATYLNNGNAELLEKYMTGVGMRGLTSEWWHFQDDETRESIGLSSYLYKGVDMGGWTRDDTGWRYRNKDGSFFKNTTVTVDGKRWTLDGDGYAVE